MSTPLMHNVFFTLTDSSPEKVNELVDACKKYLNDHDGVTYFAAGARTPDLSREVNDQTFHVALCVSFDSREAHDAYQVAPRHLTFIEEQKGNWSQVRVFDADLG